MAMDIIETELEILEREARETRYMVVVAEEIWERLDAITKEAKAEKQKALYTANGAKDALDFAYSEIGVYND
tara:strand:+ start:194 stop:409 length:216 start_codon:yes stop_codon:yes gene_type:complete